MQAPKRQGQTNDGFADSGLQAIEPEGLPKLDTSFRSASFVEHRSHFGPGWTGATKPAAERELHHELNMINHQCRVMSLEATKRVAFEPIGATILGAPR